MKLPTSISKLKNSAAGKFIGSGLLKTAAQTITGFIVLRWLAPEEIGEWQSYTIFVGYVQLLTLGVPTSLNRELPYLLGKGDIEMGMRRLKTAGYFTTVLSFALIILISIIGLILLYFKQLSIDQVIKLVFSFTIGSLAIQTNFLGATYRSSDSFNKLAKIQVYNSILYFVLLPLIYFFGVWGYVAYQFLVALVLYLGYAYFRPYRVKYIFELDQFKTLVSVGFVMYYWNYMASLVRTIPRLILVLLGNPLMVGLFSPAGSINAAMLNLPSYINRYLYPKMSYLYGKTDDNGLLVYQYAMRAAKILLLVMFVAASVLALILPYAFPVFFPKYVGGLIAAQITIFSGVFFSTNALFHNTLNSMKVFKPIKFIIILKIVYIFLFTGLAYLWTKNLLISVSIGSLLSELFNLFNYTFFLRRAAYGK